MKQVIKLLWLCQTVESPTSGYYCVKEEWGTCFHRWANNVHDRIEVRNGKKGEARTYTRIPSSLSQNVHFVYAKPRAGNGVLITLGDQEIIIGGCTPQISRDRQHNHSFLTYSPTGTPPVVEEYPEPGEWVMHPSLGQPAKFRLEMLCPPTIFVRSFPII